MSLYKELPTAFPWYDNIKKQNRFKEHTGDRHQEWGLITPSNATLPFEFFNDDVDGVVDTWEFYDLDGVLYAYTSSISSIRKIVVNGKGYFYYDGSPLATSSGGTFAPGMYYSKITMDTGDAFYSEVFQIPECTFLVSDTINIKFLKLEWWNSSDIAPIFYNDFDGAGNPYFKNIVYLDTFVHVSEPEILEEGEKDGNDEVIPIFQKAVIKYRIAELVPDYLKIALVLSQMHDNITITTSGAIRSGKIDKLTTNTTQEQGGAFSSIEVLFIDEILIKKGCGENMQ